MSAISGFAVDDPSLSPTSAEPLIALLPTQNELAWWKSLKSSERRSAGNREVATKMKSAQKNCQQLQALLNVGKPVSDYPGLLALGVIRWSGHIYTLRVTLPLGEEGSYAGFSCLFDQSMVITAVLPSFYTL